MKIKGKVVLITGASSGIGKAAALAFHKAGAKVAIAARRMDKLEEVSRKMREVLVLKTDISDEKQARLMVDKTVQYFGKIDILINNAAAIIVSRSDRVKSEDLIRAFKTNLVGPVTATNQAVKYMKDKGFGHIINIGSPGFMIGIPFYAPYVCSKASLSAWTRTIQAEWAGSGIMVSEYFPGYIKTESLPESRLGTVDQDLIMDTKQNLLSRLFIKPKTAEDVSAQLVKLAQEPKIIVCSDPFVRLGSFLSNFPFIRLSIARGMARNARVKLGISIFGE
jgi:NAD(P)-dependent dehydrogenase (short-subunit alcohol dehydrogenase family)